MERLYPIGIQNFPNLIRDGFIYIDKTDLIYKLTHSFRACFLSRPRRFGKSLLLSTIESYFKGERELFRGLAIERLEKDWISHPVIHIDLNNGDFKSSEKLESFIDLQLKNLERRFGLPTGEGGLGDRFEYLIESLYEKEGQRVVILIDEYDKPMLEVISDKVAQEDYRDVLKPFYGTLKKCERFIRFIFITGVTKFAKLSVFSDLNQLKDISLLPQYSTICGITREEMLKTFPQEIEDFAQSLDLSKEEMITLLEKKYDGYHFSRELIGVLNPLSLLNALSDKDLDNYWFQTGTPTFLVKLLKEHNISLDSLSGTQAKADFLTSVEDMNTSPIPVIFQSGYLTISDYDKDSRTYTLDFPNEEVKESFLSFLLPFYANLRNSSTGFEINQFLKDIRTGQAEAFMKRLQSLFSTVNYELILNREAHYQNVLYIVFELLGLHVQIEKHTSQGSIDMIVQTAEYVYIMEFKYEGTTVDALNQIYSHGYIIPYQCESRKVILIAVNFNNATRNLDSNWIIKPLN